jgi:hypothetical protein
VAYNPARTVSRLDRRVKGDAIASGFAGSTLTFTLPYKIATDGSEGTLVVARISTGAVVASTRPAINQVAVANVTNTPADFYIGVLFTTRYRFSTIMKRSVNRDGQPIVDARGRLQLRYLKLNVHDTSDLTAVVTLDGRAAINYPNTTNHTTPDKAEGVQVSGAGPQHNCDHRQSPTRHLASFALDSAEWDGSHVTTTTRV